MLYKANADRRYRTPEQRHRVTNWPSYEAGLRARGSFTVWFTAEAIEAWGAEPRTGRGGQPRYSALAITTALTLRAKFRLALRQTVRPYRLHHRPTRARARRARSQHDQPTSGDAGGAASAPWARARAPAGGQHGIEALRPQRVGCEEARHKDAARVAQAPSRHRRRHRADRRVGADRQGYR
ncbi:transposase [Belnapia sp. T18]|uniref:Transposase n=1 Tax=Belnapia arida TaxID=2804533 RepID=A0ABS1UEN7_9PROT|nr:transposase [Belnapia arida]